MPNTWKITGTWGLASTAADMSFWKSFYPAATRSLSSETRLPEAYAGPPFASTLKWKVRLADHHPDYIGGVARLRQALGVQQAAADRVAVGKLP